jgi:hypothetical protein
MTPINPPPTAPTAAELLANPVVQAALAQAWVDSLPADPVLRHEEGGWIYLNLTTGELTIRRAPGGEQSSLDLLTLPIVEDAVVVGLFHTHPNPSNEGWQTGPSPQDLYLDELAGVPDLIRADDGIHLSGPDSRRGGLGGSPGFPS